MKKKVIIGIIVLFLGIFIFNVFRYNLTYGNSASVKIIMAGCMYEVLKTQSHSNSKTLCECTIDKSLERFGDDFLDPAIEPDPDISNEIYLECIKLLE